MFINEITNKHLNPLVQIILAKVSDKSLALEELQEYMQGQIKWHRKRESEEFNKEQSFE